MMMMITTATRYNFHILNSTHLDTCISVTTNGTACQGA